MSKRFLELYENVKNPIIIEKSSATEYFITEKEILKKQHSEKNSHTFRTQNPKICYNNKTYVCDTNELLQMTVVNMEDVGYGAKTQSVNVLSGVWVKKLNNNNNNNNVVTHKVKLY